MNQNPPTYDSVYGNAQGQQQNVYWDPQAEQNQQQQYYGTGVPYGQPQHQQYLAGAGQPQGNVSTTTTSVWTVKPGKTGPPAYRQTVIVRNHVNNADIAARRRARIAIISTFIVIKIILIIFLIVFYSVGF